MLHRPAKQSRGTPFDSGESLLEVPTEPSARTDVSANGRGPRQRPPAWRAGLAMASVVGGCVAYAGAAACDAITGSLDRIRHRG